MKVNRKRRKILVTLSIIALLIFGFSLPNLVLAADKPLVIHDTAMSRGYTKAWEWWAKEVEKQTNGEVAFKFLWGGVLGVVKRPWTT